MTLKHWVLPAALAVAAAGCQTYHRRPLEPETYAASWANRSLDLESVRAYAEALGEPQGLETPFDSSDGLSLAEAEAVALHFNPRLRLARAQANVPLAGAQEAGWWPDPQFEAEFLRFLDRGQQTKFRFDGPSLDGVNTGIIGANGLSPGGLELTPPGYRRVEGDYIEDPWIIGASLSFTIPISGRLAVERDVSWSEYGAAWRKILVAEWETLTKLRDLWLEWSTVEQRISVTRDYLQSLEKIADIAQQLARAGEMKPTEARVLRIELARRKTTLQSLEAEAAQQRLGLLSILGITPEAVVVLKQEVFVSAVDVTPEARQSELLDNHPRIKAAEAEYETAEQRLRLQVRLQYPDLQIGPGFSFEEGLSRLGFGFGLPIPLWNRNRQGIAQASAEREAARIRAEAEVEIVVSELARVTARLDYASRQRQYLIRDVAPLVDRQLQDSRTLLNLGEVDVLLLRDALTSSLETKLEVLDATLAEARAANTLSQMLRPRWFTKSQAGPGRGES